MIGEVNLLGPQLVLMVLGAFLLIADLGIKDRRLLVGVALAALGASVLYSAILLADGKLGRTAFDGILVFDEFALFFQFLLAGAAIAAIAASWETLDRIPSRRGEYLALILFSTTGLMLLAGTRDLIGIFIALELSSISQYILVGFHKDRLSSEAGLKYLLTGAIASAVLLYGMAILIGLTGSTNLPAISEAIAQGGSGIFEAAIFGAVLLIVGFGFKAAVAPFQMWVPDAYTGAPTPIAAYLSVASKAGAFAVLIRVFFEALGDDLVADHWKTIFAALATLSMFVGNVLAIQQSNIKRMLAYSSVAQAGTILIGLAAISADRGDTLGASGIPGRLHRHQPHRVPRRHRRPRPHRLLRHRRLPRPWPPRPAPRRLACLQPRLTHRPAAHRRLLRQALPVRHRHPIRPRLARRHRRRQLRHQRRLLPASRQGHVHRHPHRPGSRRH
jgi:NADH-quinone oxidoreductase subunit N